MKKIICFSLGSLFAATCLFAEGELKTAVATVNGKVITKDDLHAAFIQLYPQQAQDVLNRLVNETLISYEAEKRKIKANEDEINQKAKELGITGELSAFVKKMITVIVLAEKMIVADKQIKVSENEIKEFFDKNKASLGTSEQYKLRQIYVKDEKEASDILVALKAGANFGEMAKVKSQDASSRDKGGDLGYYEKDKIKPEYVNALAKLKDGEITGVIKSDDGFHILKIDGRKPAMEAKYDKEMKKR